MSDPEWGRWWEDDGFHKFSLAYWFMEREYEKISAWIDADTPLDAPAMIRARFKSAAGDPRYAQIDFSFSPRMALPCDFWLDDFVEIFGEKGVMWINQCSGGKDRDYFKALDMSGSPAFPPIAVFVDGKVTTYLDDVPPGEPQLVIFVCQLHAPFRSGGAERRQAGFHG